MNLFGWLNKSTDSNPVKSHLVEPSVGSIVIDVAGIANQGESGDALKIEAVYSCLRDKSETIGQIPLKMYRVNKDGTREQLKSGRNHRIFTEKPCDYTTLQQFMELLVVSVERFGAFYAYKEYNDRGSLMSIIPFKNQGNITPNMDINGNVYYTYMKNNGQQGNPYYPDELYIVKSFTLDGYTPVSPMKQTATNLGIAYTQDNSYEELQRSGITSQMALSTEQVFKDENAIDRLKDTFKKIRGINGFKEIPVFEQGLKPISLKLTPQETELLSNREFTVNRICRTFRVPLHRVGVITTAAKSDVFELDEAYMRDSLNPILVKAETAFNEELPDGFKVQFDRNAFYSGSPWRLLTHVEKGVKGGLLTINEGRTILGWELVEGGNVFAIDNNNVVYGFWNELEAMQERLYGGQNNNNSASTDDE
tara:strand:- start:167 stop:1432 length:1266 start_codon:yes stop_codon:yes gene_type:complete